MCNKNCEVDVDDSDEMEGKCLNVYFYSFNFGVIVRVSLCMYRKKIKNMCVCEWLLGGIE